MRKSETSLLFYAPGVYALSGLCAVPLIGGAISLNSPVSQVLLFCGAVTPSLVALLLTAWQSGAGGVRDLLSRAARWRFPTVLYAVALLLPAVLAWASLGLHTIVSGHAPAAWLVLPGSLLTVLISPLGEEFGWRGFVLPRLQQRHSPVVASLLVGGLWAGWHYWYFLLPGWEAVGFGWFLVGVLGDSFWHTWLYNRAGGSVLPAILLHGAGNLWYRMIPLVPAAFAGDPGPYAGFCALSLATGMFVCLTARSQPVTAPAV